jgi:hypothetical protein
MTAGLLPALGLIASVLVAPTVMASVAITIIGSVVAIAVIGSAITVVATAIVSSVITDLFNGRIAFRLKWQSSDTRHRRRLDLPADASGYKYCGGHHTGN